MRRGPSLVISLLLAILPFVAAFAAEPSFDCAKSASPMERLICGDGALASLDRQLADAFAKRRRNGDPAEAAALIQQQRQWLKTRERACPIAATSADDDLPWAERWRSAPCVARLTRGRLSDLGAASAASPPAVIVAPDYVHPLCIAAAQPYFTQTVPPPVPVTACNAGNAHNPPQAGKAGLVVVGPQSAAYPFYAYQRLGALPDGREVGLVRANGGNSLNISEIVALRRRASADGEVMLSVDTLVPGGDLCAAGMDSALLGDSDLQVVEHATPAELMVAAGAKMTKASPDGEQSLADCTACCAGTVRRRWPLRALGDDCGGDQGCDRVATVVSARVTDADVDDDDDGFPRARCFSRTIAAAAPTLPHDFDAPALAALGKAFDACVAGGGK